MYLNPWLQKRRNEWINKSKNKLLGYYCVLQICKTTCLVSNTAFSIVLAPEPTECLWLKSSFLTNSTPSCRLIIFVCRTSLWLWLDSPVYYAQISLKALWSGHHWWPEMKWWTEIGGSWPSPAAAESSAHRAGKPDDSNSLMSKLTDRSVSSVIGFEV